MEYLVEYSMIYHDFNLKGNNYVSDMELILEAHKLGWNYLNLIYSPEVFEKAVNHKEKLIQETSNIVNSHNKNNFISNSNKKLEIEFGIEISPRDQNELYKFSKKCRNKTKFLAVLGGDLGINRGTCENRQVDVLSRPYRNNRSCGINHVLAKEAVENDVAIELCFNDILSSYLSYRAKIMAHFREIIKLYNKFKFPLIITSGASSIWDLRSPRDISAVFKYLGLSKEEFINCTQNHPKKIIDFNNERKNMVVLGVKKINKNEKL
jgi:ribonuclease P/MRP protein subunit RPP1